jgi:branched-chain amino acid aminotransferase
MDRRTTHDAAEDPRNADILIYVDGRIVPKPEAVVSVYDAGFMLGDGVWEGLRLHRGTWVFLGEHLERLFEAARAIDLEIGMDRAAVVAALEAVRAANGMATDAHARLMVTRGRKARPFQHPSLSRWGPTVVIIAEHSVPAAGAGVRLATVPQVRGLPMSQDPKLNSHSKLNCVLAAIQAEKAGADEALMLDPHGFVNTTNACNFFVVRRGEVWTSSGDYCMNGITRAKVIGLCREHGLPLRVGNYSLVEVYGAEEAFLTGSFGGLTPVASIDGRDYAVPGPVTARLQGLYRELVERG